MAVLFEFAFEFFEALFELGSDLLKDGDAGFLGAFVFDVGEGEDEFELIDVAGLVSGLGLVPPFDFFLGAGAAGIRMETAGEGTIEVF